MFRQASLLVGAIVLIAGVNYRPSVCKAGDNVKPASKTAPEKKDPDKFDKVDLGEIEETPPAELDVDPTLEKPAQEAKEAEYFDDSKLPVRKSGGTANGSTNNPADGSRKTMLAAGGGTKHTERAVTAALVWLANHQDYDGHWSLTAYSKQCKDKTCTGIGDNAHEAAATAMGLLPFLAAGQTQKSKGPYREHILKGITWLIKHQQPDGNLAKGEPQMMYSHGLATIALCEVYGLSGDAPIGRAAQKAVDFILAAQNTETGGWRYMPKEPGDTSVLGWQLTALKSADMAGLKVDKAAFAGAAKWLDSVAVHEGAEYSYQPGQGPVNTMTSEGLLGRQYLGAKRDCPMLTGGMKYLMNHLPDEEMSNIYYWYYGTQVMHNISGLEWDAWNRKMRDLLVKTQVRNVDECANGSWDPEKDHWGKRGGRVMQTSLSTLTLEIYYRYLPIFKAEAGGNESAPEPATTQKDEGTIKPDKPAEKTEPKPQGADSDDPFGQPPKAHPDSAPAVPEKKPSIQWLVKHQQPDGNLAKGSTQMMNGHGLATIALSEDYGMTGDINVGKAAQGAVNFILKAQNKKDGGWRYNPNDPGDTCVLGWQLTALKSAHLAGLDLGDTVFMSASKYLDSVSIRGGTEYGYQPSTESSTTMTAVGLLGRQFLGVKRDSPMLTGGMKQLMDHLPDESSSNIYYWFYGTQVMHNMSGLAWDTWNHKIRDVLVRTQVRDVESCANGSWDPAKDVWGKRGGRLMQTSLSALTLEVYYRYLPIFKDQAMPSEKTDKGKSEPQGAK